MFSCHLTAQRLSSEVGVRVARKMLDTQKQQGQAAVAMIQAAAEVAKAAAPAAGASGVGSVLDTTA